jgi:hypothetical protein
MAHRARVLVIVLAVAMAAACGKKGPPLPPLRPVPGPVTNVTARLVSGRIEIHFTIPSINADRTSPAAIARVEVYARSVPKDSPRPIKEQIVLRDNLVDTIDVKPAPTDADKTRDAKPGAPPPPPDPRPGIGEAALFTETVPTADPTPLPPLKGKAAQAAAAAAAAKAFAGSSQAGQGAASGRSSEAGAAGAPANPATPTTPTTPTTTTPTTTPTTPTTPTTTTPTTTPTTPTGTTPTTTATGMAGAAGVGGAAAGAAGAGSTAGATKAGAPAAAAPPKPAPPTRYFWIQAISSHGQIGAPPDLIAVPVVDPPAAPLEPKITYDEKTLTVTWQPGAEGEVFRVYDVDSSGKEKTGRPLGDAPLKTPELEAPVEFDVERCLAIRAVDLTGVVAIESEATEPRCVTPKDTFPPPAPANLNGLPDAGALNLRWDPVTASDLAGYLVLRGEGTGDTLQQLTPAPVTATTFVDATVRPGVTYVYVVVAVDKSTPPNVSPHSNSYSVTIR